MKRLLVIAIILLTGMGVSINNTKKVNEKWGENGTANRIDTSLSEESKERLEKNQQEIEKIINDEIKAEEIVEEKNENVQEEKVKQEQKEEKPQVQSNSKSNANKKQENKVSTNNAKKTESTPKQEISKESVAEVKQEVPKQETPKQEEKVKQTTPKQEEKIYCVDGGKTHIAGDGANEHGYYKTWDEAFSAYEKYTEDWESSHFKINQCFCGLYYFSVTK